MPNVMAALPNIGGALCSTLQSLADAHYYTVSQKKVPTFKLSVALSNLNRFSKFLHRWKVYEICYKIHITIPTSP